MENKNIFTAFVNAFRTVKDIKGRVGKFDYWGYVVVNSTILTALGLLYTVVPAFTISVLWGAYAVISFCVTISMMVRRLHDTNHSGLFVAIMFVGFLILQLSGRLVSGIVAVVFSWWFIGYALYVFALLCWQGDERKNQYGEPTEDTPQQSIIANLCIVFYLAMVVVQFVIRVNAVAAPELKQTSLKDDNVVSTSTMQEKNSSEAEIPATAPRLPMHNSVE